MRRRPAWLPDPGWTGDWTLPSVLEREISDEERGALVALSMAGWGPGRLAADLEDADRVTEVLARTPDAPDPASALGRLHAMGVRAVVPSDPEYPSCLAEIAAPPLVLYVLGRRLDELVPCVAIVGARSCTDGARRFARRLGAAFAAEGFTVVSGLARGIDGAAHMGGIEVGTTVAVLGTGPNRCYPLEHQSLADDIVEAGAIVTEFPPGVGPRRWHFPARNRIISGLSVGVVVVEAGERSGALITVGFAIDQGREVLACTVGPENPAGAGVRGLLRDGATLVVDPKEAAQALAAVAREQGFEPVPLAAAEQLDGDPERERPSRLGGDRARVFASVTEGTSVERLAEESGLPIARVASVLSALELDGLVADDGGGRWRRLGA